MTKLNLTEAIENSEKTFLKETGITLVGCVLAWVGCTIFGNHLVKMGEESGKLDAYRECQDGVLEMLDKIDKITE